MEWLTCGFDSAVFLIFSENVFAPLIYYSHLGPLVASLLLGFLVLAQSPRRLENVLLFSITIFFSIWVYFDLILWATEKPEYSMFFWSAMIYVELLIFTAALYLVLFFANGGKDVQFSTKSFLGLLFIPLFFFAHTSYNLLGFDFTNCDRAAIEGPLWQYVYLVELLIVGWTAIALIRGYRNLKDSLQKRQLLFVGLGVLLFLLFFTAGNITLILSLDWSYEQYKLFGMPILIAFIAYSIVRFKTFKTKLIATQALVASLAVAVLSLLFLQTIPNIRIIAGITFIFVCILGYILVRSVKREIEQRERIEELAGELQKTNERQETLIHFVGHEVKGFLTKNMGAFAAIAQGDFGAPPDGMKPFVEAALAESRLGADSVGNILKASNLKKGTVTFTKAPFDLAALAADVVQKLKPSADRKGLSLILMADPAGAPYMFTGDKGELGDHVLRNLIDNAINYTLSGSIDISLKKQDRKIVFAVRDSGVGITEEDKQRLFTEGGHGKDSQKVNAHSTGYGLYIAKSIVEAHGGTIRAESEGQGKGSTFIVELPA